jgi:dephospho-CoA kinase
MPKAFTRRAAKMIIGLSGYAQVGKDTVAQILVENHGYTRLAFADIIKNACYILDPIINLEGMRLAHAVDKFGWDSVKELPEVRRLLQAMGSEVGRELIDPQIWVELTMHNVSPKDKIVISDVRFRNEAEEIKWKQGQIWRISRIERDSPINLHRSETDMDSWDFDHYLANNGTLDDLRKEVKAIIKWKM